MKRIFIWIVSPILLDHIRNFKLSGTALGKSAPSYSVTINTGKIFERPQRYRAVGKYPIKCVAHTSVLLWGQMFQLWKFYVSSISNRDVRFCAFKLMWWGSGWKVWNVVNSEESKDPVGSNRNILQSLAWFFFLYFIRQNIGHSCHPISHLYSMVQLTKHLLITDHFPCMVSGKRFAKTSLCHCSQYIELVLQPWRWMVQCCVGKKEPMTVGQAARQPHTWHSFESLGFAAMPPGFKLRFGSYLLWLSVPQFHHL